MKAGFCAVCTDDEKRAEIDAAHIAGASIRELAKRFARSKDTVQKHVRFHIPAATQRAVAAAHVREADHGDSILAEVGGLQSEARRLQSRAEGKRDYRTAIAALRELVRLVELKARLLGELRDREINVTNVQIDPATAERMATVFLARRGAAVRLIEAGSAEATDAATDAE